jgi:Ca-activated chloride channel homolog
MRLPAAAAVAAAILLCASPWSRTAAQQKTFRSGAPTVAIYATVTDAAGRLVTDLTRDDFDIYDNGKRQPMTVFANDVQPITVVMMLDRSGSMAANFNLVRTAAEQFVSKLLPADKARIGSFAARIQVDPREFTSSQRDLIEILRTQLQEAGPTPLWNAVYVGITGLLRQAGRRVVLVFTDGVDRPMNSSGNNNSLKDVMKLAQEEDVMVYAIGLVGRAGFRAGRRGGGPGAPGSQGGRRNLRPVAMEKPDPGLPKIAAETGGGYFELTSTNDLTATFTRVVEELHRQYALAFSPEKLDGKTHKIEVRLRDGSLTARARKSYVAKGED